MKTLTTIYTHTNSDGAERPEDPNLKDVNHLAENGLISVSHRCDIIRDSQSVDS